MISRTPRPWVRNVHAQRTRTTIRLENPIRKKMWMPEPQRPGQEAALPPERPEPADVGDPREPPDDRHVAVVAVAERLVRTAQDAAPDDLGGVGAALHRALRHARRRLARASTAAPPRRRRRRSPGCPGIGQVGLDDDPPGAIGRGAGRRGDGPRERRRRARRPPRRRSGPRSTRSVPSGQRRPGRRPRRCASPACSSGPPRRDARAGAAPRPSGRADRSAGSDPSPRPG